MRPNFLGVGVQRAGTTWVHECLSEHPEAFLPQEKEMHFFSHEFDRGMQWYEEQFEPAGSAVAVGEVTPNYFTSTALTRIAEHLPDARIFAVLREPVSRAYSAYGLVKDRLYPGLSFEEACNHQDRYLVGLGMYAAPVKLTYELFPRENVKFILYDDVEAEPLTVMRSLYAHLEIRETFVPEKLKERVNQALYPKTQATIESLGLGTALETFKSSPVGQGLKRLHAKAKPAQSRHHIAPELSARLREQYRPDINALEVLLDRDLSHWLTG